MTPDLVPVDSGTFRSFDDTQIYYEVRGSGRPIILNYGIGCLINHWRPQITHFARTHQVIAWDYRGHHRSRLPADHDQISVDAIARDLHALIGHLGVEKPSLWGHSFGAQVLARFYETSPRQVGSLIFINGFVDNPLKGMFGSRDLTQSIFKTFRSGYQMMPETLGTLWRLGVQSPLAIHLSALAGGFNLKLTSLKDIEIYARGVASMDLEAFLKLFESMTLFDGRPVLDQIRVPTMIIAGKQDSVTPLKHQEEMHRKVRDSELCVVPYGSHCTQLDMPDLVNLKIEKFLAGL